MHPAYQRIIAMGPSVLPLILRELEHEPDHWMWALKYLVGKDVAEGQETIDGARRAWLSWGHEQHLIGGGPILVVTFGHYPFRQRQQSGTSLRHLRQMVTAAPGQRVLSGTSKKKIAIYADPATGDPTHAARQLANGRWTSKLGKHEDI